jgi:hypothetical protein
MRTSERADSAWRAECETLAATKPNESDEESMTFFFLFSKTQNNRKEGKTSVMIAHG